MNVHAEKIQDSRSSGSIAQRKTYGASAIKLVDNRADPVTQRMPTALTERLPANKSMPLQDNRSHGATAQLQPVSSGQVVQRFEPLTMGLIGGALAGGAYGAYRYFRHRQRENTMASITSEQQNQQAVVNTHFGQGPDVPSTVQANVPNAPQHLRAYTIDLNANNPVGHGRGGPSELRIAEIHERTHISADQTYSMNAARSGLELHHNDPAHADQGYLQTYTAIDNRTERLKVIVQGDNALSPQQRAEILSRVNYAQKPLEYDPVINELLAYTREYGIRSNSATVKALVVLARENLTRRQPNTPTMAVHSPI